jgi:hypothetical protein
VEPDALLPLVAELGRRTGVCWLRYDGRDHPAWHVWHEGALLLVSGGQEQPLPHIEDATQVQVVMRSKDTGGRLATWSGVATTLPPRTPEWDDAVAVLVAARLNLESMTQSPQRWAETSVVTRVVPDGEVVVHR